MLNKCIWENPSSRTMFVLFIADQTCIFFQQYFMIKDSWIRSQMGRKWERFCNQIKECFRLVENSTELCIQVTHSCYRSLSRAPASEFPIINHWDKAVFPALRPQVLNPMGTMTRSPASSFPTLCLFNSQIVMLQVGAGLLLRGHVSSAA